MKDDIIIHPREEWGAESVSQSFSRDTALGIVLHNMQNANRTASSDPNTELALSFLKSRDCQHLHIHENGWSDTGQNFTISRGGVVMEGRKGSLDAAHHGTVSQGAHASGVNHFNRHFHGIELEGDFRASYAITDEQKKALINLCAHLRIWARNPTEPNWKVIPHAQVLEGHTDCPGLLIDHMDEIRVAIRSRVNELLSSGDVTVVAAAPPPPLGTAKVHSPDGILNVRSEPKRSAKKLRELKNGDVVNIFALSKEWCQIAAETEEWVARQYLEPEPAPSDRVETVALPSPSVDHRVSQVDTLYEVFYSDEAKKTLRRDVPLFRLTDRAGLFHRGSMQIDVDGSPRAYYPKNANPLRLDKMTSADGEGGSSTYIQGKKYGNITALGPRPGFYVSATSLRISEQRMWDCDNFVDAEYVPYFIHPPGRNGVDKGDVGIIVHIPTLKWTAAIFGDSNDQRRVSEASLRVAVNLERSQIDPVTLKVTGLSASEGDDNRNYFYLYFPGNNLAAAASAPHWPEDAVKALAEPLFAAWGGIGMVKECLGHI